jgi:superfamily II DNA helicase RecQ
MALERPWSLHSGSQAKLEQIDLLWSLVFDREDRILVAKTGYGKSVVSQLLPLLTRSSIVIVLLPLNALGAEQLADIQRLSLTKPIWLSSKIMTRLHYEESELVSSLISWYHRKSLVA